MGGFGGSSRLTETLLDRALGDLEAALELDGDLLDRTGLPVVELLQLEGDLDLRERRFLERLVERRRGGDRLLLYEERLRCLFSDVFLRSLLRL